MTSGNRYPQEKERKGSEKRGRMENGPEKGKRGLIRLDCETVRPWNRGTVARERRDGKSGKRGSGKGSG